MPRWFLKAVYLLALVGAVAVSVDISPKAAEMLLARGSESAWISNVYYT